MNGQNKPNARQKRVVGAGKGIEKKGEGLGIGPVGQMPGQSAFEHVAKDAAKDAAAFVAKEAVHHAAQKAQGGSRRHRKLRGPRRELHGLRWAPPTLQPPARAGHRTPGRAARAEHPWAWAGADAAESCF